jgi:hypothetical protein
VPLDVAAQVDPLFTVLEAGGLGRMALVGDSIAFRHPWELFLREELGGDFGKAGYGFRGINPDFKWTNPQGTAELKVAYTGTGTNIVKGKSSSKRDQTWGLYTPDGIFSRLRSDGAVTLTIPAGHTCTLHYLIQPSGGTLAVDRSGVRVHTINTAGSLDDETLVLAGGAKYKLYSTSSAWVQVNALEVLKPVGFTCDRLGRGQDNPKGYNTGNTTSSATCLGALGCQLVMIQTDWFTPNQSQGSFITDLKAYIDWVRAALPDAGLILVSHHAMYADSQAVSDVVEQIAIDKSCGWIDHLGLLTYQQMLDNGYIQADGVHLTDAGGAYFANYDADLMRATR